MSGDAGRPRPDRAIAAALTAYAGGDALGVPWEGKAPDQVDPARAVELPPARGWPRGATSDDTALTLLVAEHLLAHDGPGGADGAGGLLRVLAERAGSIRGLGPSTRAAIDGFERSGRLPATGGRTNGAVMRALPAGWATAPAADEVRREWVITLSSATHPHPEAQAAACVVATCASWAVEGADRPALLTAARGEAARARARLGADAAVERAVRAVERGTWTPPAAGVSLEPAETLAAVLHSIATTSTLEAALLTAIGLGGDTDTVAALVGGILGARLDPDQVGAALPWIARVALPAPATIDALASGLAAMRRRHSPG